MRVRVIETSTARDAVTVRFFSEFGQATARWVGACPQVNTEHDVEFSIPEPISSWTRGGLEHDNDSIETTPQGTRICAKVDSVDADGLVVLRLGNSLMMVESRGSTPPLGSRVCIAVKEIALFPYTL